MAEFTAKDVMALRERTGAGMMDCKKALTEAQGDVDKAIDLLREKGLAAAAKKASRVAAEGLVGMAFTADGSAAAMVEVNSETDFVAKNPEFTGFVEGAVNAALAGDHADVAALGEADFGNGATVSATLTALIAKIGENMALRRFVRLAKPGCVYTGYTHTNGKIGVLVELETAAPVDAVREAGRSVAMQVASMRPLFVDESDVDQEWLEKERHILLQQALNENAELEKPKPAEIVEKMVGGRVNKELKETCLLQQAFVKDNTVSVAQYVAQVAKEVGQPIKVTGFVYFQVGEGIEKKETDLAAEVAAMNAGK